MGRVLYAHRFIALMENARGVGYVRAPNGVCAVPLTAADEVIFIHEPSPALGENVLYLPSGRLEDGDLSPEAAANRELQEEIGLKAARLDYLGKLFPWSKYLTAHLLIYLARSFTPSKLDGDEGYAISTEHVPLADVEGLITSGRLHDATIIAALSMARSFVAKEAP
jgi:ADP-ribose diphosphatase